MRRKFRRKTLTEFIGTKQRKYNRDNKTVKHRGWQKVVEAWVEIFLFDWIFTKRRATEIMVSILI